MRLAIAFAAMMVAAGPAGAAGDFPLSSCGLWNGTIIERSGINTPHAEMQGIVTLADIEDYCERDPQNELTQHGGRLSLQQCEGQYLAQLANVKLEAEADCRVHTVTIMNGKLRSVAAIPSDNESCASGYPPLASVFAYLCPTEAKRLGLK